MTGTPWLCPHCKRRVPAAIAECRCGIARATQAPRALQNAVPWDIKLWVTFGALMWLAGLYQGFLPPDPPRATIPLLGWAPIDATPPPAPIRRASRR